MATAFDLHHPPFLLLLLFTSIAGSHDGINELMSHLRAKTKGRILYCKSSACHGNFQIHPLGGDEMRLSVFICYRDLLHQNSAHNR